MQRKPVLTIVIAAVMALCIGSGMSYGEQSPADQYITTMIDCIEHTQSILPGITAVADSAAHRSVNGGRIYVTDDEELAYEELGGFVSEATARAGGMIYNKRLGDTSEITANDIVLVATIDLAPEAQKEQIAELKEQGALVVVFGSDEAAVADEGDFLLTNNLGAGSVPVIDLGDGEATGPAANLANVINMWVFTSEYAGALTRLGKMPAFYQSIFVKGSAERNAMYSGKQFHDDMEVEPVEAGVLGMQYSDTVKGYFERMREEQLDNIAEAGEVCADAIKGGDDVILGVIGHFMKSQFRMPEAPDFFDVNAEEYGDAYLADKLEEGDVWLHVGYSYTPVREIDYADEVGATIIAAFTPGPQRGPGEYETYEVIEPDYDKIDIYINPYWKHGDAIVEIPGYDVNVCPPSGVVMVTTLWMVISETEAQIQ
jgi:uncharacterized phosphosugar-binding protein